MSFQFHISRVEVWSGDIPDRAGAAAAVLEVLSRAGADLKFLFTRPHPTRPEASVMILAPIIGPEQTQAARSVGLEPAPDIPMLCVEGDNIPGIGSQVMGWLAVAGVNLRGLSISAVGDRFVAYLAFDSPQSATRALQVLASMA
jgi:hypothetical protein